MAPNASTLRKRKGPSSDGPVQRPHPCDDQVPCQNAPKWSGLWYASDCSGLDSGAIALARLTEFRHWFASEIYGPYRHVFTTLHPTCERVFADCQQRSLLDLEAERKAQHNATKALIYTAGFPCQPFSKDGLREGSADPRANVIWNVLLTIATLRPDCFILENVPDLACDRRFREHFQEILDLLVKIGPRAYYIDWQILDSHDYGVPASRRRVYIVGVLRAKLCRPWQWPKELPKVSLRSILVPRKKGEETPITSLNTTCLRNLAEAFKQIKAKNDASWKKKPWVIDCKNSSSRGVHFTYDKLPTITRSHADHLWLVCKNDFVKPVELLAAQGIVQDDLPVKIDSLPANTICQMAGNAFTATVMRCLLDVLLEALGYGYL